MRFTRRTHPFLLLCRLRGAPPELNPRILTTTDYDELLGPLFMIDIEAHYLYLGWRPVGIFR
jgi:hypothetical protein